MKSAALPQLFIAPKGSTLPPELTDRLTLDATDFQLDQKLAVARANPGHVVLVLTNRELAVIAEYRDLFGFEITGLLGLPGGHYDDTVFASYMATMPTIHVDALLATLPNAETRAEEDHDYIPSFEQQTEVPEDD